jgi:hypothetical protein
MKVGQFATPFGYSLVAVLALMSSSPSRVLAQHHESAPGQRNQGDALVQVVRQSTERFRDVAVAEAEGYHLLFGCVSGPDYGAMGLHYVNLDMVFDGEVDATRPEIVIYEPMPDGRLRLIGADYLVIAEAWNTKHETTKAPELNGQIFHLFESPNRFGLPAFYTLHVWAWKDNPNGAFVNWHPKVSCESFSGQER